MATTAWRQEHNTCKSKAVAQKIRWENFEIHQKSGKTAKFLLLTSFRLQFTVTKLSSYIAIEGLTD